MDLTYKEFDPPSHPFKMGDVVVVVDREGWTPEHDDTHIDFEMARAAAFYALHTAAEALPEPSLEAPGDRYSLFLTADQAWPPQWDRITWKKPKDARRNLVRGAALLIAEIERLDRVEARAALSAAGEQK